MKRSLAWVAVATVLTPIAGVAAAAVAPAALSLQPNLVDNIERPLRYRPDAGDFVIENGAEFFNRPLYGGNTAFRVDAGDRPEFVLYLPGRGGNLRLGLRVGERARWLHEAAYIEARYRPGAMRYMLRDPELLGNGAVEVDAIALRDTEGLVVRVTLIPRSGRREEAGAGVGENRLVTSAATNTGVAVELLWAYGGVNGQRGRRDGDIGTENVPISEWFQLRPEFCRDNRFAIDGRSFTLESAPARIAGLCPPDATLAIADAAGWSSPQVLLESAGRPTNTPVLVGRALLRPGVPAFLALQRLARDGDRQQRELQTYLDVRADRPGEKAATRGGLPPAFAVENLPAIFARAEEQRATVARQIAIETPDPFLNAAVGAFNIAADAVWDEPQGVVMHGAIAWRSKLLGWRGPYAMDALGWHERARRHLAYWATRQNTDPIPEKLPPPDENANLARSEAALHSNGDISNSHYDMNLVYIDALFRHLLWTGDLDFAREVWPVIERHLAWERRLFRREFTTASGERLPLYEAYAAIWASDDLQYHGGGVTHASAYNYWHNHMAARLAALLGHDPALYESEAALIARGMREFLWLEDRGRFAEFNDLFGQQRVHPSAALWTFYHTMDAGLPTPREALAMSQHLDVPAIPIRGPSVPDDADYHVLSTTDWMPYSWSINNVVFGENMHTALGLWQGGRPDAAFRLMKSALLASMYMGICPGNVGSMNYLDVYRRESQRDFADGSGVLARAIVEGLFGVRPDALAGRLRIEPGFPAAWGQASLEMADLALSYRRDGDSEHFVFAPRNPRFQQLILRLPARGERVARCTINSREVPGAAPTTDDTGRRWLEVRADATARVEFAIEWAGEAREPEALDGIGSPLERGGPASRDRGVSVVGDLAPIDLIPHFNDRVTEIFRPGKYRSPRSPFVSLAMPAQGIGAWAGHVDATAEIDDRGLRATARANGGLLTLPNGISFATPGEETAPNILFVSLWDNYPDEATIPLAGRARCVWLLMAGSTNHMQSRFDNGEVVVAYTDGTSAQLALHNPTNWWPIEQDYFIDDFQFRRPGPIPPRVDLKTGEVRLLEVESFKGRGGPVPGGAATVLFLDLDPEKELRSLTVRALANEVVIGLMALTLER